MFSQSATEWGMARRAMATQGDCGKDGSGVAPTMAMTACCYASGALSPRSRCAARRQLELARMRQPRLTTQEAKLLHSRVVHELLHSNGGNHAHYASSMTTISHASMVGAPHAGKPTLPAMPPSTHTSNVVLAARPAGGACVRAQPPAALSSVTLQQRRNSSNGVGAALAQKAAAPYHLTPLPRFTSAAQEKRVQAWCAESLSANTLSLSHSLDLDLAEDEPSRQGNESAPSMTLSWSCLTAHTQVQ